MNVHALNEYVHLDIIGILVCLNNEASAIGSHRHNPLKQTHR
jgi:hypothetical protein